MQGTPKTTSRASPLANTTLAGVRYASPLANTTLAGVRYAEYFGAQPPKAALGAEIQTQRRRLAAAYCRRLKWGEFCYKKR